VSQLAVAQQENRSVEAKIQPALSPALHGAIRRRAEEIYHRNGDIPGRDQENWTQAEAEILQDLSASRRTAVVINVEGLQYVAEYNASNSDGYAPGEFQRGAPVPVRIEGDKMFVTRRNGRELETRIVHRVG
jgi:hypothetical protein